MESSAPLNRLRALWAEDRCALGAIATIPSVQTVQILAAAGLDFIIIDMEHGPIGPTEAHAMIATTAGSPLVPLVRVAATTPWHAKVPLDLGAMGVCFPLISTREDAEAAVRAVRYPPVGERAWRPFYAPPRWGLSPRDYQDRADARSSPSPPSSTSPRWRRLATLSQRRGSTLPLSVPATWRRAWGIAAGRIIRTCRL